MKRSGSAARWPILARLLKRSRRKRARYSSSEGIKAIATNTAKATRRASGWRRIQPSSAVNRATALDRSDLDQVPVIKVQDLVAVLADQLLVVRGQYQDLGLVDPSGEPLLRLLGEGVVAS